MEKYDTTLITRYVRDASGNVMSIYADTDVIEQPIYGSSRIGQYKGSVLEGHQILGRRSYELSNHLGNVLSVITDNIGMNTSDSVWATVQTTSDYYPFGLAMDARTYEEDEYRYGFNGKEKDDKGEWGGTTYDYGFRIYNPRIAKFLSIDPLTKSYPWYTPYQFAGNKPIWAVDLDGLEELLVTAAFEKGFETELKILREDEVFSTYISAITQKELVDTDLVIFKLNKKTPQASTTLLSLSPGNNAYLDNKNVSTESKNRFLDTFVPRWSEISGLTEDQVKSEIAKKRAIHVVNFNPMEIHADLDWTLNGFLHEIDIHLVKNINGEVRTEQHQDHKEAFLYDQLSEKHRAIIDVGSSPIPSELPKDSRGYQLNELILKRIAEKNYKKEYNDEKEIERNKIVSEVK